MQLCEVPRNTRTEIKREKGRPLSLIDQRDRLFELLDIGVSCEEIAKTYDVNPSTVYRFRRRFYLTRYSH